MKFISAILELKQSLARATEEDVKTTNLKELALIYQDLCQNYLENQEIIAHISEFVLVSVADKHWKLSDEQVLFCIENFPVFIGSIGSILKDSIAREALPIFVSQIKTFTSLSPSGAVSLVEALRNHGTQESKKQLMDKAIAYLSESNERDHHYNKVVKIFTDLVLATQPEDTQLIDYLNRITPTIKDLPFSKDLNFHGVPGRDYPAKQLNDIGAKELAKLYALNTIPLCNEDHYFWREEILQRPLEPMEIKRMLSASEELALVRYFIGSDTIKQEEFYSTLRLKGEVFDRFIHNKVARDLYLMCVLSPKFDEVLRHARKHEKIEDSAVASLIERHIALNSRESEIYAPDYEEVHGWCYIASELKLWDAISAPVTDRVDTEKLHEFVNELIHQFPDSTNLLFEAGDFARIVGEDNLLEAIYQSIRPNNWIQDKVVRLIPEAMIKKHKGLKAIRFTNDLGL